jgi:signal peptidase
MAGPYRRFVAWTKDRSPPLHRFLTDDARAFRWARTFSGLALALLLGVTLLWGGTGQPLGEPPVVVVESGSMMHCDEGPATPSLACGANNFGRFRSIDPGDLVFVRDVDGRGDVQTFAQDGARSHHGAPGDVIVYARAAGAPIIHRAMFWLDVHADRTFTIPELGLENIQTLDQPELRDRARWGLVGQCPTIPVPAPDPALSGWITKGDNNPCWDQGSNIRTLPVRPDEVIGKARGEIPWMGLLKLWVYDFFGKDPNHHYDLAPRDLRGFMWTGVVLIVGGPWVVETVVKKRRQAKERAGGTAPDDEPRRPA